jgi:SAM-dependent methyltransferase
MVRAMLLRIRARLLPLRSKREGELRYWQDRVAIEGALAGGHYEWFFTDHFELDRETYVDRSVLDVGCGPRGSLEWADQARMRVGLDPLAWPYRSVGTGSHAMQYVGASSDAMPFQDGHFDVVSSFNSLDHVDDLERTTVELARVLRPGGVLLLLAEVNQPATIVEPITLTWETPSLFPTLEVVRVRRYEMTDSGLFDSVRAGTPFDDADPAPRTGVISVLFRKA